MSAPPPPPRRTLWKVLAAIGALMSLGPIFGLLGTVVGLQRSFHAVGRPGVDPSLKSEMLADGISWAMSFTAAGIVAGVIGIPLVVLSLVMLLRKPREPASP